MMKSIINISLLGACIALSLSVVSCKPNVPTEDQLFYSEDRIAELTKDGKIYTLNEFMDAFMTEKGNYLSDTTLYRTRANNEAKNPGIWLFSIDTLPSAGEGIYIRGRITTDDFGGNFYKAICIQQIVNNEQQAFRLSVDMGSVSGLYPLGQEILIRCNGLAIGRYANQPQLCVPSYNNNVYANNAGQKIGWAPGRIPGARFKAATYRIGTPEPDKLMVDEMTIAEIVADYSIVPSRKLDGKLIRIKNIHFTGQYNDNNEGLVDCSTGNPATDGNANVFAPTTGNVGYPQSRAITDPSGKTTFVSSSEYAKYANYYLPGADSTGVAHCADYSGTVTGILSFYMDNASYEPEYTEWAVSIRDLNDLELIDDEGNPWIPQEYVTPEKSAK